MLYYLFREWSIHYSFLNVFRYLTLRGILSVLTALFICFVIGPVMIRKLSFHQIGQTVRTDGPQTHFSKAGTPTMGGALILTSIFLTTLLWADLTNGYIWVVLLTMVAFGTIGWVDDYMKLIHKNPKGIGAKAKFFWQTVAGFVAGALLYVLAPVPAATTLIVPFFKHVALPLGVWFVPWTFLVVVGSSNAVNLTDGLDGLAIMPTVLVAGGLAIFAYVTGHATFSSYLEIPYVPGAGEVLIFCSALMGAGLGFLWFNTYPAQVFMGDVGALGLGASLGIIAIIVRQEIVLFVMGGIFVLETISVVVQVTSFKLRGRRVFRMAPIHHHFELKGWPEPRVIVRFWIITFVLVLVGLATLKIR